MKRSYKGAVVAAAVAGFFFAGKAIADNTQPTTTAKTETTAKVKCFGVNECKGNRECEGAKNGCHGQNGCKGQGWEMMKKEDCVKKGGTVK